MGPSPLGCRAGRDGTCWEVTGLGAVPPHPLGPLPAAHTALRGEGCLGNGALPSLPLLVEGEEEEDDEEEDDLDEEVIDDEEDEDDDLEGEEEEDGVDDEVRLSPGHTFVPCLVARVSQEPLWGQI